MVLFVLKFIITNIIFSLIIWLLLISASKQKNIANAELFLYSLGFGPAVTGILLYYLFLLIPGQPFYLYVGAVGFVFLLLLVLSRKALLEQHLKIKKLIQGLKKPRTIRLDAELIKTSLFFGVIYTLFIFFVFSFINVVQIDAHGHDFLGYGLQGRIIAEQGRINMRDNILDKATGFHRPSYHAPGLSLLSSWEVLFNKLFDKTGEDSYFKSVSMYYGLLILAGLIFWVSKKNRGYALIAPFILLSGSEFYYAFYHFHVDTYRIFLLSISWIMLVKAIIYPKDIFFLIMLGVTSGLSAFTHSLNALIGVITIFTYILFIQETFLKKIKNGLLLLLLFLFAGGIHYLLDIFIGTGWIFGGLWE